MTQSEIQSAYLILRGRRETINREIAEVQTLCKHPSASEEAGASAGNYDPSADRYWVNHECSDCGKRWSTPQ